MRVCVCNSVTRAARASSGVYKCPCVEAFVRKPFWWGGSCLRVNTIRPFLSIGLACAVRQRSSEVRALCDSDALLQRSHLKLHTSHCTHYTTLRYNYFYNCSYSYSYTTLHYATLHYNYHYTTLQLQLQVPLRYITYTIFFHQPHLHDIHHLHRIHDLHHHLYHCILYITYIFKPI